MTLELRHLRYFVAVAEELHFGRAARRLNLSQPPLSQQIRRLEQIVGAALFVRTSRRVELTTAGTALLDGARRTLAEATRSVEAAQRGGRGELDMLRVGFTDSAALAGLPALVRAFRSAYPLIHLDLIEGTTESQLDSLVHDLVDVALVRGPVGTGAWRTLILRREPFVVALAADHRLAGRRAVALKALRDDAFVLFPRHLAQAFHDVITNLCRAAGFEPTIQYESAEYETILSLVAAGLGVSLVPASVRNLRRVGVAFRPLTGIKGNAEIVLVYRPHRLSRPLENLIQTALRLSPRRDTQS